MEDKIHGNANENERRPVAKLPNRKYGYFRDDQFICLVSHPGGEVKSGQLETFRDQMNSALEDQNPKPGRIEQVPEVITFPNPDKNEGRAFSLIRCWIQEPVLDPLQHLSLVEILDKRFKANKNENPDKGNSNEENFTADLNFDGLVIEGVSLNWITSIASQGSGTGGPGGIPSPYYGSRRNAPYTFNLQQRLEECEIYGDGTGVDVVILDTAPSTHDLVAAHKEWPDHPLIETLLGPDGKLHLYPTDYKETLRLGNLSLNDSDYKMTDHGLFIAGIIHSIVPQAEIHLIEVLNQNGVGDYHAFNAGMQKAINDFKDPSRKLVINCSWMLDFPVDEHHCHHAKVAASGLSDPDIEFEEAVRLYVEKNEQAIAFNLEAAFDRSDQIGRGTIAAAGNDGYDDEMNSIHIRPKARYPAALTTVLGVGALPTTLDKFTSGTLSGKYKVSDFSNRSDREDSSGTHPPKNGFATLGGEPGERKGILGLYLGEFPDGRRNTSKWAWWSGTSFATPLLTAAVASILSNKYQPVATTRQAIQKVREYLVIGSTDVKDEEAVPLTQC